MWFSGGFVLLRAVFLVLGAISILLACEEMTLAQDKRPGVDCGCELIGAYQVPSKGVQPAYTVTSETEGTSPQGNYRYVVGTTGSQVTLVVYTSENQEVLNETFTPSGSAYWGFGPHDGAFVYHFMDSSGYEHVKLFRLKDSVQPLPVAGYRTGSSVHYFSRRGRYFFYGGKIDIETVKIVLVDTWTSDTYTDSLTLQLNPLDKIGLAGWGFNYFKKDKDNYSYDVAFFYAWIEKGTGNVRWKLISLDGLTLLKEDSTGSGTWFGFSPCGDILGIIDNTAKDVKLFHTGTGEEHDFSLGWSGGGQLSSDSSYHLFNGTTQLLENLSGAGCPEGVDTDGDGVEDTLDNCPQTPNADQLDSDGDGIGDACEVTQADSDGDTIPDESDNCPGTPNQDQADTDGDGIGDACELDQGPPQWSEGSVLSVSSLEGDSLKLGWPQATDDIGIIGYRIYQDSELLAEVGTNILEYRVGNLTPLTEYTFSVQAGDFEGQWSTDGPSVTISTPSSPPSWPEGSSLRAQDIAATELTLLWDPATDDVGVTGYKIRQDGADIGTVSGTTLTYRVTGLQPCNRYSFSVAAGDADGNWTWGPFLQVANDTGGPDWAPGSELQVTEVTSTSLTLSWPEAQDTCGVMSYRVYLGGRVVYGPPGNSTPCPIPGESPVVIRPPGNSASISCLRPGAEYTFGLEAEDKFGNRSASILSATVSTEPGAPCTGDRTERVSILSSGEEFFQGVRREFPPCFETRMPFSSSPSISGDGQVVAFISNLEFDEEGPWIFEDHAYIRNRMTGETEAIRSQYGQPVPWVQALSMSSNGRYVGFRTPQTVQFYDAQSKELRMVAETYTVGNVTYFLGPNGGLSFSPDNGHLAFSVIAPLVAEDTYRYNDDVYVYDLTRGTKELVTKRDSVLDYGVSCGDPVMSEGARYVAFTCGTYTSLGESGSYVEGAIYVYDRSNGSLERVDVSTSGAIADGVSARPSISSDGRYVAFESKAANLVSDDLNDATDIFVRDRVEGKTIRISISSEGSEANGESRHPPLSANGRYVAFESAADNLVPGDNNGRADIFVHDTISGQTARVNLCPCGNEANGTSTEPRISGDGRFVAYASDATNLLPLPEDANCAPDIFVSEVSFPFQITSKGDINDDGTTDLADAILALQVSARLRLAGVQLKGDVNGDERIGLEEAIYALQYVAGLR